MRLTARHERLNTKTEKMNEKKKKLKLKYSFTVQPLDNRKLQAVGKNNFVLLSCCDVLQMRASTKGLKSREAENKLKLHSSER